MDKIIKDFDIIKDNNTTKQFSLDSIKKNNSFGIVEMMFNNAINNSKKVVMKKHKTLIYM